MSPTDDFELNEWLRMLDEHPAVREGRLTRDELARRLLTYWMNTRLWDAPTVPEGGDES